MGKVNEHAKIIRDQVFHTFPYNQLIPNFKGPHADDCPGCIIEAEVDRLVAKLEGLSPTEKIIEDLKIEKEKVQIYKEDRSRAFIIGGLREEGSVSSLVAVLVSEKDRLTHLLELVKADLVNSLTKMNEYRNDS